MNKQLLLETFKRKKITRSANTNSEKKLLMKQERRDHAFVQFTRTTGAAGATGEFDIIQDCGLQQMEWDEELEELEEFNELEVEVFGDIT